MQQRVADRVDTVAFDMDGTLIDSIDVGVEAARAGLLRYFQDRDVPPQIPARETIRNLIGMPSLEYFAALVSEPFRADSARIRQYVSVEETRLIQEGHSHLYAGARETLQTLRRRGFRLVLVSNCGAPYFEAQHRQFGLHDWFDRAYCLTDAPRGDKASALERALRELSSRSGVMVGDRQWDLEAGRANGLKVIGCRYGFARPGELDQADAWADRIEDIVSLLPEQGGA